MWHAIALEENDLIYYHLPFILSHTCPYNDFQTWTSDKMFNMYQQQFTFIAYLVRNSDFMNSCLYFSIKVNEIIVAD